MSNSPLVTYTNLSPHCTKPRKGKIDTITIHCIVGQWTAKQGCNYFATPQAVSSANYVVGCDGSIGLCVDEANRAWTTGGKDKNGNAIKVNGISGADNDHRAVTIEVASDRVHPYAVTDQALNALIELVADICKRNNIKKLLWKADKTLVGKPDQQNMTVHRWFANKACPGDYLYERHGMIADAVNKKLGSTSTQATQPSPAEPTLYRVQTGAYSKKANAEACLAKVAAKGYQPCLVQVDNMYKVQVGAYAKKANADQMKKQLIAAGFDAIITTKSGTIVKDATAASKTLVIGCKVRVNQGAKTYTGGTLASFVYTRDHVVHSISGNRVVISYNGSVIAAMNKDDLTVL